MSSKGPCLVVGVDFGTTYTGFAWAEIPADWSQNPSDLNPEPKIMDFQSSSNAKIPTLLCYCGSRCPPGRDYVWGEEVNPKNSQGPRCSGPYQHFKLQLAGLTAPPTTGRCELAASAPRRHDFSPADLVIDYLSAIRKEFMKNIVQEYKQSHAEEDFTIDWIFTIPGLFDGVLIQKLGEKYLPAAGFPKETTHITEPHAAAVEILSHSQLPSSHLSWFTRDKNIFKEGTKFLVCDGGGGTTDLFPFEIVKLGTHGGAPHILLKPVGEPRAASVGSIDINKAFQDDLEKVFKQAVELDSSLEEEKIQLDQRNALESFETHKCNFKGQTKVRDWKIPIPLQSLGSLSIEDLGLKEGVFVIDDDRMRRYFNVVISRVKELLDDQLNTLEPAGHKIEAMMVVGGLGASQFVQDLIQEWSKDKNIKVASVDNVGSVSMVVRGAVEHQIHELVLGRPTSKELMPVASYGFVINEVEHLINSDSKVVDASNLSGPRKILWVIKQGEVLKLVTKLKPARAIVKADTCLRFSEQPNGEKIIATGAETTGTIFYHIVRCKDITHSELPTVYEDSDLRFTKVGVARPTNKRDPKTLKRLFKKHTIKPTGTAYWETKVELNIYLGTGQKIGGDCELKDPSWW